MSDVYNFESAYALQALPREHFEYAEYTSAPYAMVYSDHSVTGSIRQGLMSRTERSLVEINAALSNAERDTE